MVESAGEQEIEFPPSVNLKKVGIHMARPRHQKGWLTLERGKFIGHWYSYVRLDDGSEVRRFREKTIGSTKEFKRWQAQEALAKLVSGDPSTLSARPDPRVSLEWFYENRFLPLAEGRWRASTRVSQPYVITKHILPKFGHVPLERLSSFDVQIWLDDLGRTLSRESLHKVRNLFHVICDKAIELEYLPKNPVSRVRVNGGRMKTERVLSLKEIAVLDQGLQGRERLVFRCFVLLGLRPGELFARRWQDWLGDRLMIKTAVYRGHVGETKTEGSKGFVWLPKILQQDLAYHRLFKAMTPKDFIFSGRPGIPMNTNNYLRRILQPACTALGVPQVTHQCLRRTCATYLSSQGTVKDVQAHLRHASATTTLDIYVKDIPESRQAAVEGMAQRLFPGPAEQRLSPGTTERLN